VNYLTKEAFVIKRLWALKNDFESYNDVACGRAPNLPSTMFQGKVWSATKGTNLPCDAEIVASVFTALLDNAMMGKQRHFFGQDLKHIDLRQMKKEDIGLHNTQPECHWRPHYEYIVANGSQLTPSGPLNLWYAIMMKYACIYKFKRGVYNNRFNCLEAIEFIFGRANFDRLDNIIFP